METPLPTKPIEDTIGKAVGIFDTHMTGRPLQIQDPFGNWKNATEQAVRDEIGNHLDNLFRINQRLDACRGIVGLNVVVFRRRAESSARSLDLATKDYTGLGDGMPVFTRNEGFSMTQHKSISHNTAHLLIRQSSKVRSLL